MTDLVDLEVGGLLTYTIDCSIEPSATGFLDNVASVDAPATVGEPGIDVVETSSDDNTSA